MAETLTFLFSDLEGSTRLLSSLGPDRYGALLSTYRTLVADSAAAEAGEVVDREGDGLFVVFPTAAGALRAAAAAQQALGRHEWPADAEIAVRIGVHVGDAERHDGGWVGLDVHRAARVASAGHGGQVLLSEAVKVLVTDELPEELELRDLGEHRLKDLDRAERLHQLVVPGMRREFPTLRTLERTPHNLPIQATSFVGRHDELAALTELLHSSRLITVTGVGGSGKTRLALQAVAALVPEVDAAWFIQLGAITDPDLVDGALLDALGLAQRSGVTPREATLNHFSKSRALILLDNCEHLIDATADLAAAILARAPDVTVVATSRELLGVSGEVVFGLRSLTLPKGDQEIDVETLAHYDAVRLFTERAAAVQPGFRLSDQNAKAVTEICQRLDGMPLALELAAPRLRAFSPEKIAALLDQRFRLLTGGSRTAVPRHQTLTATIEWSYRLLTETEQSFFNSLSVFHGGFTFDAAVAVCTDDLVGEIEALDLLQALVDKSLVVAESDGGEVRYRLLETVRQFARERLDEAGRAEDTQRRHARYFRDLAEQASRHAVGPDELRWHRQVRAESDNLRQAMTWWFEAAEPVTTLQMAIAFARFSGWSEALSWIERALHAARDDVDRLLRARALVARAHLLDASGELDEALGDVNRAIELFRGLDGEGAGAALRGRWGFANSFIVLAVLLFHHGRAGPSNEIFTELVQEGLEVARRLGDGLIIASALGNLAHHMDPKGNPDHGRQLFDEAVAATRALGSDLMMAGLQQQRAYFEFQSGDLEASRDAWRAAVRHAEGAERTGMTLLYRVCLAAVEVELGMDAYDEFVANARAVFSDADVREAAWVAQSLLVFRAGIDASRGAWERVAQAAGASAALADHATPVRWDLVTHFEQAVDKARKGLGDEAFDTLAKQGRAMSHEELAAFITAT